MEVKSLFPSVLDAPFPLRNGLPLTPRLVFIASLALAVGSQLAAADDAVTLPDEGLLPIDFRCVPPVGSGSDDCPIILDEEPFGYLDIDVEKYLEFEGTEDFDCFYPPDVSNTTEGVGVRSSCEEDGPSISSEGNQVLEITVWEDGGESSIESSLPIEGIYLFPLSNTTGEGFFDCPEAESGGDQCCLPDDQGAVQVTFADGSSDTFPYSSDTSTEFGFCAVGGDHAVFVDFGSSQEVEAIVVIPEEVLRFDGEGSPEYAGRPVISSVYAVGLEVVIPPDVSPENCEGTGEDNSDCKIQVGDPELEGGDLKAVISDTELEGNIRVVGGSPWRVLDDRAHCQPGASPSSSTETLVFNDVKTYYVNDALNPVTLPLIVSDNGAAGAPQYFTIQATSCGIPRVSFDGQPVLRTDTDINGDWEPYLDIVELDSDIELLASVLGFESEGLDGTDYACRPPGTASLATQPVMEINVRESEAKILSGAPGIINEVARDITVDCGSKRGKFRGYSFVAWNLVHAIQTDMREEIDAEIDVLVDSAMRYADCVDPDFYQAQLSSLPERINRYYDYAVRLTAVNPYFAGRFLDVAVTSIESFKSNLEAGGVSDNFLRCYASSVDPALSPRLDLIKDTMSPLATDVPLNAWGDLISQLEHLSYAIRSYRVELLAP
ncbi:MAG: hypothetical protein ACI87W_001888 [Halieaceae bacterium]|jgi:hypothetical protein